MAISMQNIQSMNQPHPIAGALYRTRLCKFGNTCQYGDRSFYAHSDEQIRPRTSPTPSVMTCKLNESVNRSSRRSSAVLSDINYDLSGPSVDSLEALTRRFSVCTENAENRSVTSNYSSKHGPPCVMGTLIPPMPDLSVCSCESGAESASFGGSLSPILAEPAEVGATEYSYYYACVRYLLTVYQPTALAQILKEAAPRFYVE